MAHFLTLDDARRKMEDWLKDYNEVRPHSAIGNKPPISLVNGSAAAPTICAKTPEIPAPDGLNSGSTSLNRSNKLEFG